MVNGALLCVDTQTSFQSYHQKKKTIAVLEKTDGTTASDLWPHPSASPLAYADRWLHVNIVVMLYRVRQRRDKMPFPQTVFFPYDWFPQAIRIETRREIHEPFLICGRSG